MIDTLPAVRFDIIDDNIMIYQGGLWNQPFTNYAIPTMGQYIMEIDDIPSIGKYSGKIIEGQYLSSISPSDSTVYNIGDYATVNKVYGTWFIVGLAPTEDLSSVTRIHGQIRMVGQGDRVSDNLIQDLDSSTPPTWTASTGYTAGQKVSPSTPNGFWMICKCTGISGLTEPSWGSQVGPIIQDGSVSWQVTGIGIITINNSPTISWTATILDEITRFINPCDYWYDIFFTYSPYGYRVKRQFGLIRVGKMITRDGGY